VARPVAGRKLRGVPVEDGLVIELVEQGSGVQARFSTTDRLGSVIHVADQQRNELERREYEPYGKSSSSLTTRAGFTGHDGDVELGLINMKGRLFDPGGRFPSPARSSPARCPSASALSVPDHVTRGLRLPHSWG
jgi:hypothetical protein